MYLIFFLCLSYLLPQNLQLTGIFLEDVLSEVQLVFIHGLLSLCDCLSCPVEVTFAYVSFCFRYCVTHKGAGVAAYYIPSEINRFNVAAFSGWGGWGFLCCNGPRLSGFSRNGLFSFFDSRCLSLGAKQFILDILDSCLSRWLFNLFGLFFNFLFSLYCRGRLHGFSAELSVYPVKRLRYQLLFFLREELTVFDIFQVFFGLKRLALFG